MVSRGININKMDAARRQLRTAITLWFTGGDHVSAYGLAYAAHEIIHAISKKKNPTETLLFDSKIVREEKRAEFAILLKKHANFFKHGEYDADGIIEFYPQLTELFILTATKGLGICGESTDLECAGFLLWFQIHQPDFFFVDDDGKRLIDTIPVDAVSSVRSIPRPDFLQMYKKARSN